MKQLTPKSFDKTSGLFRVNKPRRVWVIIIPVRRILTARGKQELTTEYRFCSFKEYSPVSVVEVVVHLEQWSTHHRW